MDITFQRRDVNVPAPTPESCSDRNKRIAYAASSPDGRSEYWYAADLWPCLPDNALAIVDRNFWVASVLIPLQRDGTDRHWLIRAKINVNGSSPRSSTPLPTRPPSSLRSTERWEIELGHDDVKTEMLESVPLRSQSVDRVRQEIWRLLIAYNLIRLEMERVADEASVPATRISFVAVFRMICDEWLWCAIASPGAIPRHLRNLRKNISLFILPPRRTERSYPRAVKVKMSKYRKKRRPVMAPHELHKGSKEDRNRAN